MLGAPSFSKSCLCIQSSLQSQTKIFSSTSVNFHLQIPPLLIPKTILTIPTNTAFLCTFLHLPTIFTKKYFPYLSHLANSGCVIGPMSLARSDTVSISPFFLKVWTVITGRTITDSLLFGLIKLVYCR